MLVAEILHELADVVGDGWLLNDDDALHWIDARRGSVMGNFGIAVECGGVQQPAWSSQVHGISFLAGPGAVQPV